MEIFELLQGCMCFLEVMTLFFDGTAAYSGIKTYQKRKKAAEHHALKKPSWIPFVVLLVFAIGFTALTVYKYVR